MATNPTGTTTEETENATGGGVAGGGSSGGGSSGGGSSGGGSSPFTVAMLGGRKAATDASLQLTMSYTGERPDVDYIDLSGGFWSGAFDVSGDKITIWGLDTNIVYSPIKVIAKDGRTAVANSEEQRTWALIDGVLTKTDYNPHIHISETSFTFDNPYIIREGNETRATVTYIRSNNNQLKRILFKNLAIPRDTYLPTTFNSNTNVVTLQALDGVNNIVLSTESDSNNSIINIEYERDDEVNKSGIPISIFKTFEALYSKKDGLITIINSANYSDEPVSVTGIARRGFTVTASPALPVATYADLSGIEIELADISGKWGFKPEPANYKVNFLLGQLAGIAIKESYDYDDTVDTVYFIKAISVGGDGFAESYNMNFSLRPDASIVLTGDLSDNTLVFKYGGLTLSQNLDGNYIYNNGSPYNLTNISDVSVHLDYTDALDLSVPITTDYFSAMFDPSYNHIAFYEDEILADVSSYTFSVKDISNNGVVISRSLGFDVDGYIVANPNANYFLGEYTQLTVTDPAGSKFNKKVTGSIYVTLEHDAFWRYYIKVNNWPTGVSGLNVYVPSKGEVIKESEGSQYPNPLVDAPGYALEYNPSIGGYVAPTGKDLTKVIRVILHMSGDQKTFRKTYNVVSDVTGLAFPCFLGDAPVLTPTGWRRIDSLTAGDEVVTAAGATVPVRSVSLTKVPASTATRPFVIAAGQFGAKERLLISPRHRVAVGGRMVEAQELGLPRDDTLSGTIEYYNLELPAWENMVVAGVEVESQAPLKHVVVSAEQFQQMFSAKYGALTPALAAQIRRTVRFLPDGRVECTVAPKHPGAGATARR